jgi:hypothetical protein
MATSKTAYVSPPHGLLEIGIIRDANPRVSIALDLGIPNFTVFSMTFPLAEGHPRQMSELIAEAVNVLLDEVATFMLAQEYDESVIVKMYQTVLSAFKSMSTEADTAKDQDALGSDPTVQIYEGTFDIPMEFINETQKRVVTGGVKKIERTPKVRHIELRYSPKDKIKPTDTARVIRQYRNRSLKQQPKPMFVIVYDQLGRATGTIPIGTGKTFKNQLLKMLKKGSVDFTAPVSFSNEQEMKAQPLQGIPRTVSIGGMTYQPEGVAGADMALYHGPQDYLVKFPDGRSETFPGRPTFRKMRLLNFPVPKSRTNWTLISEEQLQAPKDMEAPAEEIKEAAEPEVPQAQPTPQQKPSPYTITKEQVMDAQPMYGGEKMHVKLTPTKTYDDLVPADVLQKRLLRDKLNGRPIFEGLMIIDRVGYWGTYEGKPALVIPQYYVRRYGVKNDDGTWNVYHARRDGRAQRVGVRALTDADFQQAKPVNLGI